MPNTPIPLFWVRCIDNRPFLHEEPDGTFEVEVRDEGVVDPCIVVGRVYPVVALWHGMYDITLDDGGGGTYPAEFFERLGPVEGWPG